MNGGRARIVVLPVRRELSWKKQDPPYRLMDVLASALSDQLSCWLHQRVQREWQINYRNEANLLFLSQRAAVCFPPARFPSFLSTALGCVLFYIYSLLLVINPYKLTQEKDLLCMREVKVESLLSENVIEIVADQQRKNQALSCLSTYFIAFRPFHSKSTNKSIFQVGSGAVMTSCSWL